MMTPEQSSFPMQLNVRGRRDKDGTEHSITLQPLRKKLAHLMALKSSADAARDNLGAAVKAVAQETGLVSSVVRKLVNARCGERFDDARRAAEQTALIFDEIGDDAHPELPFGALDSLKTGAAEKPKKNGKTGRRNGEQPPAGEGAPPAEDPLRGTDLAAPATAGMH
jgi:hypothetical protein